MAKQAGEGDPSDEPSGPIAPLNAEDAMDPEDTPQKKPRP